MIDVRPTDDPPMHAVSMAQAFRVWLRVASLSFGGPAGQIAVMHRIIVEEKRWIGETRFLHALNYCMLLPGPEAQQLATYIGWLMHRTAGGIMAGGLFILPGMISIMALSYVYVTWGHVAIVVGMFAGLKAAVLAIVFQAVIRIGRRALKNPIMLAIAVAAFIAIYGFAVPFPWIIAIAGLIGLTGGIANLATFRTGSGHAGATAAFPDAESLLGEGMPAHAQPTWTRAMGSAAIWLLLWIVPVAAIVATLGRHDTFSEIALFFSKIAMATFGGAYAVLAYVAQQAVSVYGWVQPGEMLDGLGMAETTPGPLIMVTQFVGFMGAYRQPGSLHPLLAGTLGGLLTTWVTFIPCFLWIFLGAPFIEKLRDNAALTSALSAITAAVVGVILNLAVWFAVHTWFAQLVAANAGWLALDVPVIASARPWAIALSFVALVAIFRFRAGMLQTLAGCALAGIALTLLGVAL